MEIPKGSFLILILSVIYIYITTLLILNSQQAISLCEGSILEAHIVLFSSITVGNFL